MTILIIVGDHPVDGGSLSKGWWMMDPGMAVDRTKDGRSPSLGCWVTVLEKVGDHPGDGG